MTELKNLQNTNIAFDMYGCPNRCRHCYIGIYTGGRISEEQVRSMVANTREYKRDGEMYFRRLDVSTWFREPDFSDEYRHLYDLESELSDGKPPRFEVLSIWRLARDDTYAQWAKEVGPHKCQITFFGMEETTDWFHRRKGAFRDNLIATEKLLDVGMAPRWQIFLTRKCLSELHDLTRLVDKLDLRSRVEALGQKFEVFVHTPGPDGEGRKLEHLRPTIEEIKDAVPETLIAATKEHFKRETLWKTEAELVSEMLDQDDKCKIDDRELFAGVWLLVDTNLDVYSNLATLEPWWKLGNFRTDGVDTVVRNFEEWRPLGMKTARTVSNADLAKRFGDPKSHRIYEANGDGLRDMWVEKWCEERSDPSNE